MFYMTLPLKRYLQFAGRSRRREYWLYALLVLIGYAITIALDAALGLGGSYTGSTGNGTDGLQADFHAQGGLLTGLWALVNLIPGLAVGIRRLHDTDRSGWWLLINFVPLIGAIAYLVFLCTDGTPGPNRFGPDPKRELAA